MIVKKILLVAMCVLLFALPSFGAVSDADFIELCETGTAQQAEEAIHAGANINAEDIDGKRALMHAAMNNKNPEVIAALIKAGAEVGQR